MRNSNQQNRARVKLPERRQVQWRDVSLDQLLPKDHRARVVWRFVESLDLSPLYEKIQAVDGAPGRDAVDPRILMSLWMFATIEAISSARQLAKLCKRDITYMWITGGVGVNYHLLADFRTAHGDFLNKVLTDSIASLLKQDLITLQTVAQDGMRVRANSGKHTFRRKKKLEDFLKEAEQHVQKLNEESQAETEQDSSNKRREAAQKHAAAERESRILKALEELKQLEQIKSRQRQSRVSEPRCSTTDPEARIMKFPGGMIYKPGYNVQFATDCETRMIIAVDITNSASDAKQMGPMIQQIKQRYNQLPENYLVDQGFVNHQQVTILEQQNVKVIGPIIGKQQMEKRGDDPYSRKRHDTDETFAFKQRMASKEAQKLYNLRASTAEFPNAECRNRGLRQFPVRGLAKTKTIALWHALTFNFMRMINLKLIS